MKIRILILVFIFSFTNSFSQELFITNNFSTNQDVPELLTMPNIGCYVKGNIAEIKSNCERHNAIYFSEVNNWHYVRIPPSEMNDFIKDVTVRQFHIPTQRGEVMNDTMRVNNKINSIHSGTSPLSNSYTGSGVIVGFIDAGLDFNHEDFKNPDGTTRIIKLWDQTLGTAANTPLPYNYGQEWDSSGIDGGLASTHIDIYGHGTTVAGAAVGNGRAVGKYKGIAYNADIVAVEVDLGSNFLTRMQDAVKYIYDIADAMGKPCVINASVGTKEGSHDAKDPSALFIDNLIKGKSGRLFVCSAGNDGGKSYHLKHESNSTDTIFTLFKPNPNRSWGQMLAGWGYPSCAPACYGDTNVDFLGYADTSNFNNVHISISAYLNDNLVGSSPYINIPDYLNGVYPLDSYGNFYTTITNSNSDIIGTMFMYATIINDNVYEFRFIVNPDSVNNYYWGLNTTGDGVADIWSDETNYSTSNMIKSSDAEFPFSPTPTHYRNPDSLQTLYSSFQCLESAITVGNYVNDSGYINNLSNWVSVGITRGKLAAGSSIGPTRTGEMKPDITASGEMTISSFPTYWLSNLTDAELALGGYHYKNGGTSMASPVVAGLGALYLEKCNQANYTNFRNDLINSAYTDSYTGSVPNVGYGYGKLDGFQTLVSSGVNDTVSHNACNNYTWNSITYDSTGYYTYTTNSSRNCDSTIVLNLTIHKDENTIDSLSKCNSHTWIDGVTYSSNNNSATHLLSSIHGCDSIVTLNLTIKNSNTGTDIQSTCNSYTWIDGVTYSSNNNSATYVLTNIDGCDSTVTLNLTINNSINTTDIQSACDSLTWVDGITYSTNNNSASKTYTLPSGCDSTVTLDLTINQSNSGNSIHSACDSYTWIDGITYSSSNNSATHTITNSAGCDSLVTLNLTINGTINSTDLKTGCDSLTWIDGVTYSTNNNSATHTLTSAGGCDSVVTLNLSLNNSNTGTDTQTGCNSYTWIDGITYSSNNNSATYQLTNSLGCDSIVSLNLTINNSTSTTDNQTACDSLTWIDGVTYSSNNNSATTTLTDNNGCDSIVNLNLTINPSNHIVDNQSSCYSYNWMNGTTYYATTDTALYLLTNSYGCDSVIQLDLQINPLFNEYDTISSCDEYQWHSNFYYSSGSLIDTLSTIEGCDSITALQLTINSSHVDTLQISSCDSYSWENSTYENTGFYTQSMTTIRGCDSILNLNLTIYNSHSDTLLTSNCDTFNWNNQLYNTSGLFIDSNTTVDGCDSINYLNLTIHSSYNDTLIASACDTFFWDNLPYTSNGIFTNAYNSINTCDSVVTIDLSINENQGTPLTLELILDDYCRETYWTVKDSYDSLWYEEGPYNCDPSGGGPQANDTIIKDIYLDALECYTFELHDHFSDGLSASIWGGTDGSWKLNDYNGITLLQGNGDFGSSIGVEYFVTTAIPSKIKFISSEANHIIAFPNPFDNTTQLNFNNLPFPIDIDIYDISGRKSQEFNNISSKTLLINKNQLSTGIYWVVLRNNNSVKPLKLIVN